VRLLLDTHTFLWWMADSPALSARARQEIARADNRVLVSTATAWEIAVKRSLGKLRAPLDVEAGIALDDFEALPITLAHARAVERLPWHHRDPFDRMLIAQASVEQATLVSADEALPAYGVPLLW
jgi:PIN domain nuclease of toxin-antitoxin system